MNTREQVDAIMAQAKVFALSYSLLGTSFDVGEHEKDEAELRRLVAAFGAQSQQDALDAARWSEALWHIGAARYESLGLQAFQIRGLLPGPGQNLMQGSVAEHFTKAIDAAIAARGETK